jgi:hypothetical protein
MKLFELAAQQPSKKAAKVFESYFGDSINVDVISPKQARVMLSKINKLVNEHRQTTEFHHSEKNPTYLKLMMMERVLAAKVKETASVPVGVAVGAPATAAQQNAQIAPVNPTVAAGNAEKDQQRQAQVNSISDPKLKDAMQKATQGTGSPDDQKMIAQAALQTTNESLRRQLYNILRESEVQQAQVILAAQDMVDNIQKMLEEVTSMQFKDLPALVDQIKNQVGVDQAMQFNTDSTNALSSLVQSIQGTKQQMDQALGVVTGQGAPVVPGQDQMAPQSAPAPDGGAPAEPEAPEAPEGSGANLGRSKR